MCKIDAKEAIGLIFNQTLFQSNQEKMIRLLELIDELLRNINIYELTCNKEIESAKVAYEFIQNDK